MMSFLKPRKTLAYIKQITENDKCEFVNVSFKQIDNSIQGKCFDNAFAEAKRIGANYILGYVVSFGVPLEHAWIQQNGKFFDVTFKPRFFDSHIKVKIILNSELMAMSDAPTLFV